MAEAKIWEFWKSEILEV